MRIACIGDVHYSNMVFRSEKMRALNRAYYERFFNAFFSVEADLYVCLGDLTHFGTRRQLEEIFALIFAAKRPDQRFETVIGNHDILFGNKEQFKEISGLKRLYRSEETKDGTLLFLDTARVRAFRKNSSIMDIEQSRWVSRKLMNRGDKMVVVFAHHPAHAVRLTDHEGRYMPHLSLDAVLDVKSGTGIYINGHKHRDAFHVKKSWAFLQFNDILDEPAIRILDIKDGKLKMESVILDDPWTVRTSNAIARAVLTFVKKKNDADFDDVDDLTLDPIDNDSFQLDLHPQAAAPPSH